MIFIFSYEERGRSLETLIKHFKKATTFEEFAANVYSPQEHITTVCQANIGSELRNESFTNNWGARRALGKSCFKREMFGSLSILSSDLNKNTF